MGRMIVKFRKNGDITKVDGLTLAEQTREKVYLEDEKGDNDIGDRQEPDREMLEFDGASLKEVKRCEKIGFIDFIPEEVDKIDESRIAEPRAESVYLGGVSLAEQRGNKFYVEFEDGESLTITGELDRAYTY